MSNAKIHVDIFLCNQKLIDNIDNIGQKVLTKLSKMNFGAIPTIAHTIGTNHMSIDLCDKKNLTLNIRKMEKIKEIGYFVLWTYPKQEILDAISNHDYFKAFTLSSSIYEDIGKATLINYIEKKKLQVNSKNIKGLQLDDVIKTLYKHGIINQRLKSDMIDVNKVRINFIHYKFFHKIERKDFKKIVQNIPKLIRTINKLEKIYEISN